MKKRIALFLGTLSALAAVVSGGAWAASPGSVIDQSQTANTGGANYVASIWTIGQTFTAGLTGPLTDVDLYMGDTYGGGPDLAVTITSVNGSGVPQPGNVLASTAVPPVGTGGATMITAHFATPVTVTAGTTYAILLNQASGTQFGSFYTNGNNAYAGGAYTNGSGLSTSSDLAFSTYVYVPAPVVVAQASRVGYCSVAGNTWQNGAEMRVGTFLDLEDGAPARNPHYRGAIPANFIQGVGITCDNPPSGATRAGFANDVYPYFQRS